MTDRRKGPKPGQGYNFRGEKVVGMEERLRLLAKENAKRIACAVCGNLVLPEKMGQHIAAYHP